MRSILDITAKVIPWCYTRTQNLGQRYEGTGVRKYKSTNENGNPTGVGYAFEDLTKIQWKKQGHKVEQVPTMKNGADFILNGELCQLKCGVDPQQDRAFIKSHMVHTDMKAKPQLSPKDTKRVQNTFFIHEIKMD